MKASLDAGSLIFELVAMRIALRTIITQAVRDDGDYRAALREAAVFQAETAELVPDGDLPGEEDARTRIVQLIGSMFE